MERNTSAMAWSPLGGGKLVVAGEREMFSKASKYNASYSQLSLAWLLKHPLQFFRLSEQPSRRELKKQQNL
jgi:diketogulonate reductase-like aldo/keto reductase